MNKTKPRCVLGVFHVYRRVIPQSTDIAAPLNKLLQKHIRFIRVGRRLPPLFSKVHLSSMFPINTDTSIIKLIRMPATIESAITYSKPTLMEHVSQFVNSQDNSLRMRRIIQHRKRNSFQFSGPSRNYELTSSMRRSSFTRVTQHYIGWCTSPNLLHDILYVYFASMKSISTSNTRRARKTFADTMLRLHNNGETEIGDEDDILPLHITHLTHKTVPNLNTNYPDYEHPEELPDFI